MTDNTVDTNSQADEVRNRSIMDALASKYVLVSITTRTWDDCSADPSLAQELADAHGADPECFRVTKRLLPGFKALNTLRTACVKPQTWIRTIAPPYSASKFGTRGKGAPRLLKASMIPKFSAQMGDFEDAKNEALAEFVAKYPAARDEALAKLANLADASVYPPVEAVPDMFGFSYTISQIPASTQWGTLVKNALLPAEFADALQRRAEMQHETVMANVMANTHREVATRLSSMAETLLKLKAGRRTRITDALRRDLENLATMVRNAAVVPDNELESLEGALYTLSTYSGKELRDDPQLADSVLEQIGETLEMVGAQPPTLEPEPVAPSPEPEPEARSDEAPGADPTTDDATDPGADEFLRNFEASL